MTIEIERIGHTSIEMFLSGRLDTAAAPQLERKIKQCGDDITGIILDFAKLDYISSMGLRVLLQAYKTMAAKKRKLIIRNMGESIREVFEMTGFINLLLEEERFVVIRKDEAGIIRFSLIGHLNSHGITLLTKELCQLREANIRKDKTVQVVLDAEKLTLVSSGACHLLKEAIIKSGWKHRKISIQNASPEIEQIFSNEDIKALFENREHPWEPNWK